MISNPIISGLAILILMAPLRLFANDLGATNVEVDAKRKDVTITWSRLGDAKEQRYGVEVVFLDGNLRDCRRCTVLFPGNTHARTLLAGSGAWIPGEVPKTDAKGWWVRIFDGSGNCLARFASSETIHELALSHPAWRPAQVDPQKRTERKVEANKEKLSKEAFVAAAESAVGSWTEHTAKPWTFEIKSDGTVVGRTNGKWRLDGRQIVIDWDNNYCFRFEAKPFEWEKTSRLFTGWKDRFVAVGKIARAGVEP